MRIVPTAEHVSDRPAGSRRSKDADWKSVGPVSRIAGALRHTTGFESRGDRSVGFLDISERATRAMNYPDTKRRRKLSNPQEFQPPNYVRRVSRDSRYRPIRPVDFSASRENRAHASARSRSNEASIVSERCNFNVHRAPFKKKKSCERDGEKNVSTYQLGKESKL